MNQAILQTTPELKFAICEDSPAHLSHNHQILRRNLGDAQPVFSLYISGKELLDILVSAKEQATVLFSTHILSDVEHICDEAAFLHDGKIVLKGTIEELRTARKAAAMELEPEQPEDTRRLLSVFPYLKSTGKRNVLLEDEKHLPQILHFLADQNISVLRIERQETSLEELFMEVVGK